MDSKKLDIKTILIIVLGIGLIISFMFGQKSTTNKHNDEINQLHLSNEQLTKQIDSLKAVNFQIDSKIVIIDKLLEGNTAKLYETQTELTDLKKRKHEIPTYVNALSADGVANSLSNYIQTRVTSSNTH